MYIPKKELSFQLTLIIIALIMVFANYFRLPIASIKDAFFYTIHGLLVTSALWGVFYLVSIKKWTFIMLFPPIFLLSSFASWCLYFPNVSMNAAIIEVSLNTDWQIAKDMFGQDAILSIIIIIAVLIALMIFRLKFQFTSARYGHYAIAVYLMLPAILINHIRPNTISSRAPFSIIQASNDYYKELKLTDNRTPIGSDAVLLQNENLQLILVLGESVRTDHLSFNGYEKETCPNLNQRALISFQKHQSLYTYTAASVPQILTRADTDTKEKARTEESVLSIFKQLKFETYWFANQTPDYSYADIAKSNQHYIATSRTKTVYSDDIWTDQNLLDALQDSSLQNKGKQIMVLHSIGSHWYYNYRCPAKMRKFTEVTQSRSFSSNSTTEMINSYDNSIVFMDYFMENLIQQFEQENALILYVSDHAELLGENNHWLHAGNHPALHQAAFFLWASPTYKEKHPQKIQNAINNQEKNITTSFVFHSLLDAASIQTSVLDSSYSIFSNSCAN